MPERAPAPQASGSGGPRGASSLARRIRNYVVCWNGANSDDDPFGGRCRASTDDTPW